MGEIITPNPFCNAVLTFPHLIFPWSVPTLPSKDPGDDGMPFFAVTEENVSDAAALCLRPINKCASPGISITFTGVVVHYITDGAVDHAYGPVTVTFQDVPAFDQSGTFDADIIAPVSGVAGGRTDTDMASASGDGTVPSASYDYNLRFYLDVEVGFYGVRWANPPTGLFAGGLPVVLTLRAEITGVTGSDPEDVEFIQFGSLAASRFDGLAVTVGAWTSNTYGPQLGSVPNEMTLPGYVVEPVWPAPVWHAAPVVHLWDGSAPIGASFTAGRTLYQQPNAGDTDADEAELQFCLVLYSELKEPPP